MNANYQDPTNCQQDSCNLKFSWTIDHYQNWVWIWKWCLDHRRSQVHSMYHWRNDELLDHSSYFPIKVRRGRRGTYRTCNIKILCSRLYNHGSRQYIHVKPNELSVQKTKHQNYGCSSIQPPIVTSGTWYQDSIPNFNKTFIRTRPDVAQIFAFSYFHS